MGKKEDYEKLIGRKFRPTFKSNIDHYEIRGYDEFTNMVFTKVYPCDGVAFDDEIEEQYLIGGFENGDYEVCDMPHFPDEQKTFVLHNYHMPPAPKPRTRLFNAPSCDRCVHRFGTTSNREWCIKHIGNEKCYRFKLDTKIC